MGKNVNRGGNTTGGGENGENGKGGSPERTPRSEPMSAKERRKHNESLKKGGTAPASKVIQKPYAGGGVRKTKPEEDRGSAGHGASGAQAEKEMAELLAVLKREKNAKGHEGMEILQAIRQIPETDKIFSMMNEAEDKGNRVEQFTEQMVVEQLEITHRHKGEGETTMDRLTHDGLVTLASIAIRSAVRRDPDNGREVSGIVNLEDGIEATEQSLGQEEEGGVVKSPPSRPSSRSVSPNHETESRDDIKKSDPTLCVWKEPIGAQTALLIYRLIEANELLRRANSDLSSMSGPMVFCPPGFTADDVLCHVNKTEAESAPIQYLDTPYGKFFSAEALTTPPGKTPTVATISSITREMGETHAALQSMVGRLTSVAAQLSSDSAALVPVRTLVSELNLKEKEREGWAELVAKWMNAGGVARNSINRLGYQGLSGTVNVNEWSDVFPKLIAAIQKEVVKHKQAPKKS